MSTELSLKPNGSSSWVPVGELVGTQFIGLDLASKEEPKHDNNEPLRCQLRSVVKNLKLICGHKLDTTHLPKRSCPDCWKVFFIKNEEMTKNNMQQLVKGGGTAIVTQLGNKYLKQLQRFAIFVHEAVKASKEKQDGGTKVLQRTE